MTRYSANAYFEQAEKSWQIMLSRYDRHARYNFRLYNIGTRKIQHPAHGHITLFGVRLWIYSGRTPSKEKGFLARWQNYGLKCIRAPRQRRFYP